jgi:hypothetical protein
LIKRIMLLLTVVLVMAAMMVASAMPAFAQGSGPGNCPTPGASIEDLAQNPFLPPPPFNNVINEEGEPISPFEGFVARLCTPSAL